MHLSLLIYEAEQMMCLRRRE